jgi:hypothetical protein
MLIQTLTPQNPPSGTNISTLTLYNRGDTELWRKNGKCMAGGIGTGFMEEREQFLNLAVLLFDNIEQGV